MQGGLRASSTSDELDPGAQGAPSDRMYTMTEGDATTDYAPAGQTVGSHLDSFFQGSGWNRQDVVTMATVLNSLLFLALIYIEVKR